MSSSSSALRRSRPVSVSFLHFLASLCLYEMAYPFTNRTHASERILLFAVKNAGLNATWTETYTLEVASGQGSAGNEVMVMVYNKNLLAGI